MNSDGFGNGIPILPYEDHGHYQGNAPGSASKPSSVKSGHKSDPHRVFALL